MIGENQKLHANSKREAKGKFFSFFPQNQLSDLSCGIRSKTIENIFSRSLLGFGLREFYSFTVGFFERLLRVEFLVRLPDIFYRISPEFYPIIKKIASLKAKGFIKDFGWDDKLFNDEPKILRFVVSPDNKKFPVEGSAGIGKSFSYQGKALIRALGEAIERMSLYLFADSSNNLVASFEEMGGEKAVDPSIFCGATLSTRKRIQSSPAFRKNHPDLSLIFDKRTKFRWVKADSLLNKRKVCVPLQLVALGYTLIEKEPIIRFPITTGAAAGQSLRDALVRGILEIIERDAFMITWLNQLPPVMVDLHSAPKNISRIIDRFSRYRLELYIFALPTDFKIPVLMGLAIDRSGGGPAVTISANASFDFCEAIEDVSADLLSSRSWQRRTREEANFPDLSHLTLLNRSFYWWDIDKIKEVDFLFRGEKKTISDFFDLFSSAFKQREIASRLSFLIKQLKVLNLDAYWVDVTSRELAYLKIPVVKVIVPKAQPLYVDECLPYFEGERLKSVPQKLGFRPGKSFFDIPPHPFA